jgi:type IV secretion system protein VirB11
VNDKIMTEGQKQVILQAIHERKNIIAAGGTKSGKTTFLNAILAEISKEPDRIVMIEDTRELQCSAEDYLPLKVTDARDMNDLLRDTLRATPDRIVVGEVRNGEALALLKAWNTGHDGGCSTVHSSSAMQTLERLEEMVMEVSKSPQQSTIAGAVDVIVYLRRYGNSRIVEEILGVDGYDRERQKYLTHKLG